MRVVFDTSAATLPLMRNGKPEVDKSGKASELTLTASPSRVHRWLHFSWPNWL